MKTLDIKPTVYSKSKSVAIITEKLRLAPEQVSNSKEAFEGKVMEFVVLHGGDTRVGTLTEYAEEFPDVTEFNIHLDSEVLIIEKQGKRFFPKEVK